MSCMNKVEKCFGKGFGWICALNRWSVQARANISFCLLTLQVLGISLFGTKMAQNSCLHSEQIDTLFISVGGQGRGSGWVGGHLELKAKNLHVTVMDFFYCLMQRYSNIVTNYGMDKEALVKPRHLVDSTPEQDCHDIK